LADKFSATDIITGAILPSLAMWIIPHALLSRKISAHEEAEAAHKDFHLTSKDDDNKPIWAVIIVGLASFTLPVVFNIVGLPPFLGLLTGLGALWIVTDWLNRHEAHESHASDEGKILSIIQKTDISTLKFFIGILLAVGALKHLGILGELSTALFGDGSSTTALISGSVLLGAISSILDNVPLVAASLNVFPDGVNPAIWELLALTAGTGGSLLVIGSAAGVAAMGQVKELTFVKYFKLATLPALAGYVAGIAVWLVMNRGL
jgi:Na+/H+ antiporter NhaD/arsenite permease-like protein